MESPKNLLLTQPRKPVISSDGVLIFNRFCSAWYRETQHDSGPIENIENIASHDITNVFNEWTAKKKKEKNFLEKYGYVVQKYREWLQLRENPSELKRRLVEVYNNFPNKEIVNDPVFYFITHYLDVFATLPHFLNFNKPETLVEYLHNRRVILRDILAVFELSLDIEDPNQTEVNGFMAVIIFNLLHNANRATRKFNENKAEEEEKHIGVDYSRNRIIITNPSSEKLPEGFTKAGVKGTSSSGHGLGMTIVSLYTHAIGVKIQMEERQEDGYYKIITTIIQDR